MYCKLLLRFLCLLFLIRNARSWLIQANGGNWRGAAVSGEMAEGQPLAAGAGGAIPTGEGAPPPAGGGGEAPPNFGPPPSGGTPPENQAPEAGASE